MDVLTDQGAAIADSARAIAYQAQKVAAREDAVRTEEANIQERRSKLDRREAGLGTREAEATMKCAVADAMIDVARKNAAGEFEVAEKSRPAIAASTDPIEIARNQTVTFFGRALKILRLKARDEARADPSQFSVISVPRNHRNLT